MPAGVTITDSQVMLYTTQEERS